MKRVKSFFIRQDAQLLLSLVDKKSNMQTALLDSENVIRPDTSISENSLFTGAVHEPSMVSELKKEILSLTVFLQQLGRGLRLCDGKEALTVLDFVGQAHQKYSFEDRFKALLSRTRKTVELEIKTGFANVPRGCSIQLEKQAQEYILENIRNAVLNKRNLISKLHDFMEIKNELKIREFFEVYHVSPQDVYSKKITVSGLAVQAGLLGGYKLSQKRERMLSSALGRLTLANSRGWIRFIQTILPQIQMTKGALLQHITAV